MGPAAVGGPQDSAWEYSQFDPEPSAADTDVVKSSATDPDFTLTEFLIICTCFLKLLVLPSDLFLPPAPVHLLVTSGFPLELSPRSYLMIPVLSESCLFLFSQNFVFFCFLRILSFEFITQMNYQNEFCGELRTGDCYTGTKRMVFLFFSLLGLLFC